MSERFGFIPNYNPPHPPISTTLPKSQNTLAYNRYNESADNDDYEDDSHGVVVERIMRRGSGEPTHYSSLYINNQEFLENSGYLTQQKHRPMALDAVPPALPMRNGPSGTSAGSQVNSSSASSGNSTTCTTLTRHQQPNVYKSDQNINTNLNFKIISNMQNLDSSCTANRRKNP